MRSLVTGGAGFIGHHLCRKLSEAGEVLILDNLSRGKLDPEMESLLERPGVRFKQVDLRDPKAMEAVRGTFDAVIHLAALLGVRNVLDRPGEVLSVNARTLLNVLDWYLDGGHGQFFFASTSEVYAWTRSFHELPVPTPEDVPLSVDDLDNRRASYATSKIFGEMTVKHACEAAGRTYSIARFHNVYGPRMGEQHVIPEVYRRVYEGQSPLEVYSVEHRRAFCFVDDAIEATIELLRSDVPDDVYNIGNDLEEVSIGELARVILSAAGDPERPVRPLEPESRGIDRRCPDIDKLRRATGYEPQVTLKEGVKRTVTWYRKRFEQEARSG